MRVTFLHGPMVSVLVCLALPLGNYVADTGFVAWQVIAFAATCLFFASPTHAIFEYFGVSRAMVPTIIRLSEAMEGGLPPESEPACRHPAQEQAALPDHLRRRAAADLLRRLDHLQGPAHVRAAGHRSDAVDDDAAVYLDHRRRPDLHAGIGDDGAAHRA
jgi:hypothetical protein